MAPPLSPVIEVRRSPISGEGVFAASPIKRGDVVISWHPEARLTAAEVSRLAPSQLHYVARGAEGSFLVMGVPERFVNHSCTPNTTVRGESDVAIRDIAAGEEITSDYSDDGIFVGFSCDCGSQGCRGWIGPPH